MLAQAEARKKLSLVNSLLFSTSRSKEKAQPGEFVAFLHKLSPCGWFACGGACAVVPVIAVVFGLSAKRKPQGPMARTLGL